MIFGDDNQMQYRRVGAGLALIPIIIAHVYAFIGSHRACRLLSKPFYRYVLGIPLISIFLLLSGPLITILLLIPIVKLTRQRGA